MRWKRPWWRVRWRGLNAIDTNVLIRFFTQDDSQQSAIATRLFESELTPGRPGFVSAVVILELNWVLSRIYRLRAREVRDILGRMLASEVLAVEHEAAVGRALAHLGLDLSDALIHEIGRAKGCRTTLTFDQTLSTLDGVELLGA